MMGYEVGTVVEAIAGHDKNQFFVILDKQGEYVYLVDGKVRTLSKPKKKKIKHIQVSDYVAVELVDLKDQNKLYDAHIRKEIKKYISMRDTLITDRR